jgi:hypothetical protein
VVVALEKEKYVKMIFAQSNTLVPDSLVPEVSLTCVILLLLPITGAMVPTITTLARKDFSAIGQPANVISVLLLKKVVSTMVVSPTSTVLLV